eukprot:TRINITY_DN22171_c0_g1_i1.p1 TRINITY_DN22171_c0_g1~~TRINITY_DN22171_c0_g1_i1.p1  ORF type:complete len:708 (+),score=161.29 TRINITY_DN22171_c0_g1_i1:77-2200(+)
MVTNHKIVCARAARQEFGGAYRRGIREFRDVRRLALACKGLWAQLPDAHMILRFLADEGVVQLAWDGIITLDNALARQRQLSFKVMARKRPLLQDEVEAEAYDSVSTENSNNAVVVHDGRVHRDGRTLYMSHSRFCLDRIFQEKDDNEVVYAEAARPLLDSAATGARSTLIMFGQTGTGKTYTAWGVLDRLARDLFLSEQDADPADEAAREVGVVCYQIMGNGRRDNVSDLLNGNKQIKALTGEDGQVHVRGAREVRCKDAETFSKVLREAFSWRSSESTERNETSSRSHAIVEVRLGLEPVKETAPVPPPQYNEDGTPVEPECPEQAKTRQAEGCKGMLRVVDLAGSERNFETQKHTRQMAERGGHINYSLLMLKECARIMHRNRHRREEGDDRESHVPFRASKITHLLKSCFDDPSHQTVVITTLSPSPIDCEHSLNSLQHVGMMRAGAPAARPAEASEQQAKAKNISKASSSGGGFEKVEGRGHALHSKLQDERAGQLKLRAFDTVYQVGGSIMRKYEAENMKTEHFIDPRWHREMNVAAEQDLWVLKDADAEVVQVLSAWRVEQWEERQAHDISKWSAKAVKALVDSLDLPGSVRLPSTMTGAQLQRLGASRLQQLCSDEATFQALQAALAGERAAAKEARVTHVDKMSKMQGLGHNKVHVAMDSMDAQLQRQTSPKDDAEEATTATGSSSSGQEDAASSGSA